jgi:Fe-S-cluster containining protein
MQTYRKERLIVPVQTCKYCSGENCCGKIGGNGLVDPPFVSRYDERSIKAFLKSHKKECPEFVVAKGNYTTVSLDKDGACVFLDRESGRCSIYPHHPIDCKLFPLDIVLKGEKPFWIFYQYRLCNFARLNPFESIQKMMEHAELNFIPLLAEQLYEYASIKTRLFGTRRWRYVREVRYPHVYESDAVKRLE